MTKPIHLNHATAAAAIGDVTALVGAMMENTERLRGLQKGLEAVLQGAMGDAYHGTMTNYNNDLSAYDAQVKKLNTAVQHSTSEIQQTDFRAGALFQGLGRA
ncbi:hypothetical protein ACQPZ2_13535 [Nocardia pseudovaccinii]|uniref:hypothetical protein n=1 Tax=Nocardia pseudovaccinii TaxID=189540 RepID=UPI003D91CE4F